MVELKQTYFPSTKFSNYQASTQYEDFPRGFSGLVRKNWVNRNLSIPEKHPHHKSLLDWQNSPSVSNIEKRIISSILFNEEFQYGIIHEPGYDDLSRAEQLGITWVLTREKDFLREIEETYGRMSRRRQKALDVLQSKQKVKTWEARYYRGERFGHVSRHQDESAKSREKRYGDHTD